MASCGAMDVIAIFGPTAVGKTAVAIAVAEHLRAEGQQAVAVSVDAIQVYKGLEVLSGAATAAEQQRLETRLISFVPVTETWSAGSHAARAHQEIDGLLAAGVVPIVVGGTGLYLRSALAELSLAPPPDAALRARLTAEYDADPGAARARLEALAPARAAAIAPGDRHRVIRALEIVEGGGGDRPQNELWTGVTRHPTRLIGLTMERDALRARIERRCAAMVEAGAADEVRKADAAGASVTARRALGFAELLADDPERMATRTSQYARRQMTWMRRTPGIVQIDVTAGTPHEVATAVLDRSGR